MIEGDENDKHPVDWIRRLFKSMQQRGLSLARDKMTEEWVRANGKAHRVVTVENPESLGSVIRRACEDE